MDSGWHPETICADAVLDVLDDVDTTAVLYHTDTQRSDADGTGDAIISSW